MNVVDPDVTDAVNPMTTAWLKGCREAGLPMSADYNTRNFSTFGFMQSNTSNGWRHSTAAAYLREAGGAGDGNLGVAAPPSTQPAAARSNLTVVALCHATKLVFQGQRAVGVRYKRGSSDIAELRAKPELYVAARREVILCAGAINSPWLLMVSGACGDVERCGYARGAAAAGGASLYSSSVALGGDRTRQVWVRRSSCAGSASMSSLICPWERTCRCDG